MNKEVIKTQKAPEAIGPYSQAIKIGNLLYTSGQLPINHKSGNIADDITTQVGESLKNIKAIVEEAGSSMDNVVKTTIFLKDLKDFDVVNKIYTEFFQEGYPARSCVQVARLPKDALIEIEAVALI